MFLYNSRDVSSTTEHSLTFANPTGKFRDSLIQSGAEVKDKSPQRSPPLLSDLKSDSKYDKPKEKVRRPDGSEARSRSKEDRKSTTDKALYRDNATRKDEKRARKEEKRKRREKEDREMMKKVQKSAESNKE